MKSATKLVIRSSKLMNITHKMPYLLWEKYHTQKLQTSYTEKNAIETTTAPPSKKNKSNDL